MSLDAAIRGASSGNGAEVNSSNELKVALSLIAANIGGIRMFSENDPGSVTGAPLLRSPETSNDYRLRVGMDTVLMTETFNGTAQNTGVWAYTFSTLTASQPGGYLQFGTVQGTASGHGAFIRSWKYFPLIGGGNGLAVEFSGGVFLAQLVANQAFYAGLGLPSAAGTVPTDGCWFKLSNAGVQIESCYNGVLTSSGILQPTMTLANIDKFVLVITERNIEAWVDDVLRGSLATPTGNGQPFMQAALPVFLQMLCTGVVSNTSVIRVTDVTVSSLDQDTNKSWEAQQCGAGRHAYQLQNGTAVSGPLTSVTNSTLPTTAAPSNTALTANLPALLGGAGLATLWNLAATDMIMQSWQNPAGGINVTGRTLFIYGVRISASSATAAWTAPAAGGHVLDWFLCFGHTAVSLATAETASFATGTTKAPRRIPLGKMSWATGATPIGTMPDRGDIVVQFRSPVVVNPGEFIATACRMLNGAATATGGLHYSITFDAHFQ